MNVAGPVIKKSLSLRYSKQDTNNYFIHSELDQQLDNLERDIDYYQSTLKEDRVLLEQLETDPKAFERYARENFGMLKKGETITIIEFEDSSNE